MAAVAKVPFEFGDSSEAAIAEALLDNDQDAPALDRLTRSQQPVALGKAAGGNRQTGPVRLVDAGLMQSEAGRVIIQPERGEGEVVPQLRRRRQQFDCPPPL